MLWSRLIQGVFIPATLAVSIGRPLLQPGGQQILSHVEAEDFQCKLPPTLDPSKDGLPSSRDLFDNKNALLKQVERHGTLVKVPSISYDDNGEPGEDPRWTVFYELHATLAKLYPFV